MCKHCIRNINSRKIDYGMHVPYIESAIANAYLLADNRTTCLKAPLIRLRRDFFYSVCHVQSM